MKRPKELRAKDVSDLCAAAQGHFAVVEPMAPLIAYRANADADEGLSGRAYDGVNRGGNTDTHPERHALRFEDQATATIVEFQELLFSLPRQIVRFRRLAQEIALSVKVKPTDESEGESRSIGAGNCKICDHFCVGIGEDRLKGGRCDSCRKYWQRHHCEQERPRELWENTEEVA